MALPDPLEQLALCRRQRVELDERQALAVDQARARGCSWEQVGTVLGLTRQGAQQWRRRYMADGRPLV